MSKIISPVEVTDKSGFCPNCFISSWPQQDIVSLRCSECKFISYCSKECQKEHWEKVHKLHCKYLAEKAVKPMSKHNVASCPDCKAMGKAGGLYALAKKDNPVLPCPWSQFPLPYLDNPSSGDLKQSAPIPFSLAELSGQFQSRAEQSVAIMWQLLCKMELQQHPAWCNSREDFGNVINLVLHFRRIIWVAYVHGTTTHIINKLIMSRFIMDYDTLETDLWKMIKKIDEKLSQVSYVEQSCFKPWKSFKLLFQVFALYICENFKIDAESFGFPKMCEALETRKVTSDQFNKMWQELLDTMSSKLVPYIKLVEILCGGQVREVCDGCLRDITVVEVEFFDRVSKLKGASCILGPLQVFLCGDICFRKVPVRKDSCWLLNEYNKIHMKGKSYVCDNCGLAKKSVHRCTRCLTKMYCGVECRNMDWENAHRLVCREGEVERKKKGGKYDRKAKKK